VARDLQPAPFEPTGPARQALVGRLRVPLVHAARIEQKRTFVRLYMRAMRVSENNRIGVRKTIVKESRQ